MPNATTTNINSNNNNFLQIQLFLCVAIVQINICCVEQGILAAISEIFEPQREPYTSQWTWRCPQWHLRAVQHFYSFTFNAERKTSHSLTEYKTSQLI